MLEFLLKRPVSVWIAALGLVVLGLFSLWRLPLSLLPTLERPRLRVEIVDQDRSRAQMLHDLVIPLERRLQTLDGVTEVFSTLGDGEAVVTLDTQWQTDVDRLRIEAERRLVEVSAASLDELTVEVEAGDLEPVLQVAVFGGQAHQRTAFAEKVLVPELGRLPGAGRLTTYGTAHLRPVVQPRAADLAARGLSPADIVEALDPVGQNQPMGRVRDGAVVRPLIVRRELQRLEDLQRLAVPAAPDIRLGDVAHVQLREIPDQGLFRSQGRAGVLVEVYRAPGANAVRLAREGRTAVKRLMRRSEHLQVELVADGSREVVESLVQLGQAGFLGLLLGTVVLRLMLGRWRPTLALAVVVPVSVVAAFSAFYLFGISLDIVSLAGLALAAGMLVDNSIVVLESISSSADRGAERPVVEGTEQIAMPLIAGFLTTAVVFLPLIYLKGLARAFFGTQAFAIVSTLVISLALSLTLTPLMARRVNRSESGRPQGRSPGLAIYEKVLNRILARPGRFATVTIVALGLAAAWMIPRITSELIPPGASKAVLIDLHVPKALSLKEADRRLGELEVALSESVPGLQSARSVYRVGANGRQTLGARRSAAQIELHLEPTQDLRAALEAARQVIELSPGLAAEIRVQGGAVSSIVEYASQGLEIELAAGTSERLEVLGTRVVEDLAERGIAAHPTRRALAAGSGTALETPSWSLVWDGIQLARLGLDSTALSNQVSAGLGRFSAGRASIPGTEPDIWLAPTTPESLAQIPLSVDRDQARGLPLGALARIERYVGGESVLERRNGRPALYLSVLEGLESAAKVQRILSEMSWAGDEQAALAGQTREIRQSFNQLKLALGLALLLVFLTVAALYESLAMPLVVMVTVPVAAIGGLAALSLTGQTLNIMSFLGLILLSGIVVNNAIVLIHRAEQLLDQRWSGAEQQGLEEKAAGQHAVGGGRAESPQVAAIRLAGAERYRPILMTTLTTLLGMIPLALLGGEGLELRRALATTVSGGLLTSWLAALLLVPALYLALTHRSRRSTAEVSDRSEERTLS